MVLGHHYSDKSIKQQCCVVKNYQNIYQNTFKCQKQKRAKNWSMKNSIIFTNFLKSSDQYIVLTSEYNLPLKISD